MVENKIEEALSLVWELKERGEVRKEKIIAEINEKIEPGLFDALVGKKYVQADAAAVSFTEPGEMIAKDVIRRQRLAERLLKDVLEIEGKGITSFACEIEHILAKEVEESICTLLGHPRQCPSGYRIPEGRCCRKSKAQIESIVFPASKLKSGEDAKVVYILTGKQSQLHRLMSFGIVPGSTIHIHQTFPSVVIQTGETQIAIEKEVAENIFVRKAG